MGQRLKVLFFFFCISISSVQGATPAWLNKEIAKRFPNMLVGLSMEPLDGRTPGLHHNPHTLMIPASCMKLVTGLAAFDVLGSDFTYKTTLHEKEDALYVKFSGDPSLHRDDLKALLENYIAEKKKAAPNWTPPQKLVIDVSLFGFRAISPFWLLEDVEFCYGGPVWAGNLNENQSVFHLVRQQKGKAYAIQETENPFAFKLTADVKPSRCNESGYTKEGNACTLERTDQVMGAHVYGLLPKEVKSKKLCFPIDDEMAGLNNVFRGLLKELDIKDVAIELGQIPKELKATATHASKPLKELITKVFKKSNNLYADALFWTVALKLNPKLTDWKKAGKTITRHLTRRYKGLFLQKARMLDGSGLSMKQLLSARQLVRVLRAAKKNKDFCKSYLDNLCAPLEPKTSMKARATLKPLKDRIIAKTGTMTGAISLSGYYTSRRGRKYAFSIIVNNFSTTKRQARVNMDGLLKTIDARLV